MLKLSHFILSIFVTLSAVQAATALHYKGIEGDYFSPTGLFEVGGETKKIKLTLEDSQPTRFRLEVPGEAPSVFPCLTVRSEDFFERVGSWLQTVRLIPERFLFRGEYEQRGFSFELPFPRGHEPLPLTLESMVAMPNFETGRLMFHTVMVRTPGIGEAINILEGLPELKAGYPLSIKAEKPFSRKKEDVISFGGIGVYPAELTTITYEFPRLPRIIPDASRRTNPTTMLSNQESIPYQQAVASVVINPRKVAAAPVVVFAEEDDFDLPPPSEMTVGTCATQTTVVGAVEEERFEHYFQLAEEEAKQVESPYVWSEDGQLFLTQTFERDCYSITQGVASKDSPWRLRYTVKTPMPVSIKSGDTRLQIKPLKSGLYQFETGVLVPLQTNTYLAKEESVYGVRPIKSAEVVRLISSAHGKTKEVYPHLGLLHEYIVPAPQTVAEVMGFQDLVEKFEREGFPKTVFSASTENEHLLVPFLQWVRTLDLDWLEKPENKKLFCPRRKDSYGYHAHQVDCAYNSKCPHYLSFDGRKIFKGPTPAVRLIKGETKEEKIQRGIKENTFDSDSILLRDPKATKFLPLFTGSNGLSVSAYHMEDYYFSEEEWRDIARYVDIGHLKFFQVGYTRYVEPESNFTIRPFVEALRRSKSIEKFCIQTSFSIHNLRCLVNEGVCLNTSIRELQFYNFGHEPFELVAKILEQNKTITDLTVSIDWGDFGPGKGCHMGAGGVTNLEGMNVIGRALSKNKTLKRLSLNVLPRYDYGFTMEGKDAGLNNLYERSMRQTASIPALQPTTLTLNDFIRGIEQSGLETLYVKVNPSISHGGSYGNFTGNAAYMHANKLMQDAASTLRDKFDLSDLRVLSFRCDKGPTFSLTKDKK